MKIIYSGLLLASILLGSLNQSLAKPPSSDYELLFEDNFSGSGVNEQDWSYRLGRRSGGNINGINAKENVTVSGGELHIGLRHELIDGKFENTGGGIISKHQFGYGYYETLSRPFMAGRGVHSSFWQSGGVVSNNNIFEIDSYEIDSMSGMGCNNLYVHLSPKQYKESPWPCRANVPFTLLPGGWFLDGYEFTPSGVVFYDNDNEVARVDWPELTAAQAVWLTALNGAGKVDADKMPGEATFKYFRYYAKDYPGVNLLPNGSFEYNQDKIKPATPVAWTPKGKHPEESVCVVEGGAYRDNYKLREGNASKAYDVSLEQSLEFIRNGNYELTAMVRSSGGQRVAELRVSNYGGENLITTIPATSEWRRISLPLIPVSNHGITVSIASAGAAGQWLEIDDIEFRKPPLAGESPMRSPFTLIGDPLWSIAKNAPIHFNGDNKFYFFDRTVGIGDAITVAFTMNPSARANTTPIARMPLTGDAGWAVQLTPQGQVVFRIGSTAENQAVVADAQYAVGVKTRVVCVFDHGTASIYINGVLEKTERNISFTTKDSTAPGRMGAVNNIYQSVGDIIVNSDGQGKSKPHNYSGDLENIEIYNRALSASEVKGNQIR